MKIKSFEGGYDRNLCYLIWCEETNIAAIIDPSVEISSIIQFIDDNKLILNKIIITHSHHDHIRYLSEFTYLYPKIDIYASKNSSLSKNQQFIGLDHNDTISVGENLIIALFTPGHYKDSMCYWIQDQDIIFTGDTIFVGRTGRTVSDGSDISDLYHSVYNIILKLPLNTVIYSGHHYGFSKTITIKDNIRYSNFFTCKTLDEFILVMKNFEDNRHK
tara:strand:+ start:1149 stop:1799 length:651 start_codon:yes stop_codon:yes gene_type:complete